MQRPFRLPLVLLLTVASAVLWSPTARATVLEVPTDHATISAAIAASTDGDTVTVAPGTYVENIDFGGKRIIVTSHYSPGGDWSLVESTIIDGSSPSIGSAASTVSFQSGEGRGSVLQGFTITGGHGTRWVDPQFPDFTWRGGGGIFCYQSSPTIRYNVITGNSVVKTGSYDGAQGGGIITYAGNPLIHNSIITANQAGYGGGLVVDYSGATVRNTIISDNIGGDAYGGGGIWTIGTSHDPILIENCAVVDNTSPKRGGAFYVWTSTVTIRNSIIWGNTQGIGESTIVTTNGGVVEISYSDVENEAEGNGNIQADPGFADTTTYMLGTASPCTDVGDPAASYSDPEDGDAAGQARWPATGGLHNDMGAYGGPGAASMAPAPSSPTFLTFIPAAAAAAGAQGSFFVTDVDVHNAGAAAMSYTFLWLPRDTDNANPAESARFTLQPGAAVRYSNVLSEAFSLDGAVGAMAVSADSEAALVMSRTYNLTDSGTIGQAMPGIAAAELTPAGARVRLLFMTENPAYRSNLGVLNGVGQPITVEWELYGADGISLGTGSADLPAWGNDQLNSLFASHAPVQAAYVDVWTTTDEGAFTCYGSVLDNATSDPTTILPR